ncbi:MAG: hypothetical protein SFU56_10910 [Capsulimonadales bacterium]|nr:hypothetical protein [Capsulimonadales bacterium]
MSLLPSAFFAFIRYGLAVLAGYLPAYALLTAWRWKGQFVVAFLLSLPFPISLSVHLLGATGERIPFYWQCVCLGCTAGSIAFLARRFGRRKPG